MPTKEIYQARKEQGLCVTCGKDRDNTTLKCSGCKISIKNIQQKQTRERKENKQCVKCGKPSKSYSLCLGCRETQREIDKAGRINNILQNICTSCKTRTSLPEQERCERCKNKSSSNHLTRKTIRKEALLCIKCGKNPIKDGFFSCSACLEERADQLKEVKIMVFQKYGEACICCGEEELVFLNIDHIEGGGRNHCEKDSLGNGGSSLYSWIIRNNYPDGFQTLCFNCNKGKFTNKECPHKLLNEKKCLTCKNEEAIKFGYCKECYRFKNIGQKKYSIERKDKVLQEYGGKCFCCGEDNYIFLSIDHINNNGSEERKKEGYSVFYSWLVKNNYPQNGYQVACYNCNCGREINGGVCPHQTTKAKR